MAEAISSAAGKPTIQALSQAHLSFEDTISKDCSDTFLQMYKFSEKQAMDLTSGEEKWEFVVKSLKAVSDEIFTLRKESSD